MQLNDYLKIGEVCEVQGKTVRAGVYSEKNTEYLNFRGTIIKNVGIGSFVLIRKGFNNIIGRVDGEIVKENPLSTSNYEQKGYLIKRLISISVLGTLEEDKFINGLTDLPLIGNFVYILEDQIISSIFSFGKSENKIRIGRIIGHDNYPFILDVQDIACSHVGIFGNTGSGKSNTVAKIYNEIISKFSYYKNFKNNSKFVFIDFNDEYRRVVNQLDYYSLNTRRKKISSEDNEQSHYPLCVDDVQNTEFWSIILEATEKTQKPFIDRCIRKFKNKRNNLSDEFTIDSICDLIAKTQNKYQDIKHQLLDICGTLGLGDEFENLEFFFSYNSQSKSFYFAGTHNYEIGKEQIKASVFKDSSINFENFNSLSEFRLFDFYLKYYYCVESSKGYIAKEHIGPLLSRSKTKCLDLEKVFKVFDKEEYKEVLKRQNNVEVISLLNVKLSIKKIVPLLICKIKYSEKKKREQELNSTLNLIVDEAHNILSQASASETEEWRDYRLESFEEIIKEGRKFGVFLTIASQRPSDISDTIISQLHNYFIHRLVNQEDINKICRSVSFADKASNEMISILPAGGCLVSGLATNFPVLVKIDMLPKSNRPNSDNVNISKIWED